MRVAARKAGGGVHGGPAHDGCLAKSLITSNPIESMISIARTTNRNGTRWCDGQMVLRWTAAGMLNAKRSFHRIKGPQADAPARRRPPPPPNPTPSPTPKGLQE